MNTSFTINTTICGKKEPFRAFCADESSIVCTASKKAYRQRAITTAEIFSTSQVAVFDDIIQTLENYIFYIKNLVK